MAPDRRAKAIQNGCGAAEKKHAGISAESAAEQIELHSRMSEKQGDAERLSHLHVGGAPDPPERIESRFFGDNLVRSSSQFFLNRMTKHSCTGIVTSSYSLHPRVEEDSFECTAKRQPRHSHALPAVSHASARCSIANFQCSSQDNSFR